MLKLYSNMFVITSDLARIQEEIYPYPSHQTKISIWENSYHVSLKQIIKDLDINEKDKMKIVKVESLVFNLYSTFHKYAQHKLTKDEINIRLKKIFEKNQVGQRTTQWYEDMKTMITASEFHKLYSGELTWARLVLSKVHPEVRENRLAVCSEFMLPTDWGIRFEPIVNRYIERLWKCKIYECGRLRHDDHQNGASPDGIILDSENEERHGRLIEIKCPYSRKIEEQKIPQDYWIQMQIQMEVSNLMECEFVEVEILSKTSKNLTPDLNIECLEKDTIYLLEKDGVYSYCYENVPDGFTIIEEIPYAITKMHNVVVQRDTKWYESTLELQTKFWEDVEKAKTGMFVVPESKSKRKKVCLIQEEI